MPKVVLCGYYGQGNAGDEALLVTLLQMLPATAEPIVLSHNPAVTAAAYGVKTAPHKSFKTLQAIAAADWFIWGGRQSDARFHQFGESFVLWWLDEICPVARQKNDGLGSGNWPFKFGDRPVDYPFCP
jgi:polysaccharide pyruvyl transferase WcaK-like protein